MNKLLTHFHKYYEDHKDLAGFAWESFEEIEKNINDILPEISLFPGQIFEGLEKDIIPLCFNSSALQEQTVFFIFAKEVYVLSLCFHSKIVELDMLPIDYFKTGRTIISGKMRWNISLRTPTSYAPTLYFDIEEDYGMFVEGLIILLGGGLKANCNQL